MHLVSLTGGASASSHGVPLAEASFVFVRYSFVATNVQSEENAGHGETHDSSFARANAAALQCVVPGSMRTPPTIASDAAARTRANRT
jgi:hypothetical protein